MTVDGLAPGRGFSLMGTHTQALGVGLVHYYNGHDSVVGEGNRFTFRIEGEKRVVDLPAPLYQRVASRSKLLRRALRLDRANVALFRQSRGAVIAFAGNVYRCDLRTGAMTKTLTIKGHSALHRGMLATDAGLVAIGDYSLNPDRAPVSILCSDDFGATWRIAHQFQAGAIRHVHGIYLDPFTGHIWVTTGDFVGECHLFEFDRWKLVAKHGDGGQEWRAVSLLFRPERIHWIMDSELGPSYACSMSRHDGVLEKGQVFPGPVWHTRELDDGVTLASTVNELGAGVRTNCCHLFASRDLKSWREVLSVPHDGLSKRIFQYGLIRFSDGPQSSADFAISTQALAGMDGNSYLCTLAPDDF